ncbi:MAG TPA: hypothetical protein VMM58_05690 [Bacteroidota bacterium]|nr:hypothetical protein [Bacteroidota bacterium]
MAVLAGLIGGLMIAVIIGKNNKRIGVAAMFSFVLIAAVQVGYVLYILFTQEFPSH